MENVISAPVRQPVWRLTYEKTDISAQIAPYVLAVVYTDYLSGQSDELDINLEDRAGRWRNGWFPDKGDQITLAIGYLDEGPLTGCGTFQVDEIELNGAPDTVSMRCLAAGVTASLRTSNSKASESTTLKAIAGDIAKKHGMTIVGDVPEIGVTRITQRQESDLSFLKRLGKMYGFIFSVRGTQLVWHEQAALDQAPVIAILDRAQIKSYTLRSTTSQVYKACTVNYWDAGQKKERSYTYKATGVTTGDTLKINERCENLAQAESKAKAALRETNGRMLQGEITVEGSQSLVAGVNVTITGFGVLDTTYQVIKSVHRMDRSAGYGTTLELSNNSAHVTMKNLRNDKKYVKAAK